MPADNLNGRPCVFCRGGPTTKEHVVPLWLRKILPGEGEITHTYEPPPGSSGASRVWRSRAPSLTVKAVCDPCNTGWMSTLEDQARPYVTSLIQGRGRTLYATGRALISFWAVKTVMLFQLAEPAEHRVIPEYRYRELHRNRRPGERVQVWLGANDFGGGISKGTRRMEVTPPGHPPEQAYASALCVGHLVLVVVGMDGPYARPIRLRRPLSGVLSQSWPDGASLTWTPSARLNREQQSLVLHMLAASAV